MICFQFNWLRSPKQVHVFLLMMTSSNGDFFRLTVPLWGESTGQRWTPLTKASDAELWYFPWSTPEQTVEQTIETPVIWDAIAPIVTSRALYRLLPQLPFWFILDRCETVVIGDSQNRSSISDNASSSYQPVDAYACWTWRTYLRRRTAVEQSESPGSNLQDLGKEPG